MKKFKIAIITDSIDCYNWQKAIIDDLKDSDFADIVLKLNYNEEIINDQSPKKRLPILWQFFLKIDSFLFKPSPNAFIKTSTHSLLKDVPELKIDKNLKSNQLESFQIDIIVNLTELEPSSSLIEVAKHGVWFLNNCDLNKINKRPYGIWEMLQKAHETLGVLRYIKKGMPYAKTIDKTSSCTDTLSYTRNINDIYWQTHRLIFNNIRLIAKDEALFQKKVKSKQNLFPKSDLKIPLKLPSNLQILRFVTLLYVKKVIQLIKSIFYFDQWTLIFLNNKDYSNPYTLKNYKKILSPKDRFWADPILIQHNNKCYLFVEELIYKNKLGHISVMEIDEEGNCTSPKKILVKDYHLSYPFVFKDNGTFYMIPETSGNKDIQLYKSTEFPLKWELVKVLMENVVAVDTTIYKENDTYWMFTNIRKHKGQSKHAELYLFSSKDLITDNWIEHPLNPIVSDIKTSRPAGSLFKHNNKLYRPSQNCSSHYGYGLNILEITELNNEGYEEKIVHNILPDWEKSINCTHTFNAANQLFISDIKLTRHRFF